MADRANHRIQIFDQDGKFLEEWKQFSRVSGLFITRDDMLYAIDSESSPERHAELEDRRARRDDEAGQGPAVHSAARASDRGCPRCGR